MSEVLIAFCTFPDSEIAAKAVRELVDLRLVACGNILPQIKSIYRWQGKVESSKEVLAVFKLDERNYGDFESKLRSLHSYDVPEIIAIPVSKGLPEYLNWVRESCS